MNFISLYFVLPAEQSWGEGLPRPFVLAFTKKKNLFIWFTTSRFFNYRFSFSMHPKSFLDSELSWARSPPQVQIQPSVFQCLLLYGRHAPPPPTSTLTTPPDHSNAIVWCQGISQSTILAQNFSSFGPSHSFQTLFFSAYFSQFFFFFGTEVFESCICVILFFAFPAPWDTVNPKLWGTGGELVPGVTSLSLHYLPTVSLLPHPPAFRHLDKLLTADKLSISQQPMSTQVHIKTKEQVNGKDRGLDFPIHLLSDHILILDMCFPLLFPGSIRLLELQGKLCGWKTQCPGVPGRLRF